MSRLSLSSIPPFILCTTHTSPEIRWWSTETQNINPSRAEAGLSAPLNLACKMLLLVHVCQWTSVMRATRAWFLPYLLLSSISSFFTRYSPLTSRARRRGRSVSVCVWGVDKEEKGAMIDLSHRHLTLSLQLIGPTSIQQCCRLFLCKHKHRAKSVPVLHCLPGSRSALFCLNLK